MQEKALQAKLDARDTGRIVSTAEEEGLLRCGPSYAGFSDPSDVFFCGDFDPTCYTESDDERRKEELRMKWSKGAEAAVSSMGSGEVEATVSSMGSGEVGAVVSSMGSGGEEAAVSSMGSAASSMDYMNVSVFQIPVTPERRRRRKCRGK